MAKLTRRLFLQDTSMTAAAVTAATFSLVPGMPASAALRRGSEDAVPRPPVPSGGPMLIHVNNVATGEMTFLVGAGEVGVRDPVLAARIAEAAGRADAPNKADPA